MDSPKNMTFLRIKLPTGYAETAKIRTQLRTGGSWSPLSSPDSVAGQVYSYMVPNGDLLVQLVGVSEQDGEPFNVRDGQPYFHQSWQQIDATIVVPPIIASPDLANACRIQLRARRGANVVLARVLITCGSAGRLADSAFADIAFDGLTDASGFLQVELPWSSIVGVGRYRFRLIDVETGNVFHDRTVTVPDLPTALYEGLQ